MKKVILIVLSLIFITACSKQNEENVKDGFKKTDKYNQTIYLPTNWGVKSGIYGDHYTNFEDIILIQDIKSDMTEELKTSLNFYHPGLIKLFDELILEQKDDHYVSIITREKVKYLISKKIKNEGKDALLSIVSDTQERAYELYKQIFR
ncbi:hypothetical protein ACKA01_06275 [Helcococcus kunzii]|uniref:Uncharacterized protein n=1 Tax=Helcococcus kunzii ATCC 51366 TaxID=883114 RepID=H3NM65_9FIRM|nr:hypothetical protein [Helcococcus kunzii]EHR35474.1 hypothetical protein HMPREF9709_00426 [Helcococcus kunzii ATCC 51366]MCT1796132.1 hypothetical protein [Helcococcus kunzii]MCT1989855.1 hypothetical protein [Helcococcus kunzii]QUY64380.1 hypothetical protein GUI37_02145 [Helcococcus kunzii]QZO76794.1 hypothetical protein HIF96_01830 [Helcococcus kunzii]